MQILGILVRTKFHYPLPQIMSIIHDYAEKISARVKMKKKEVK